MGKLLSTLLLIFSVLSAFTQSTYTLNGYISDSQNGEMLIGAAVYVTEISNGVITNPYGFYSITLPEGEYSVKFNYLGFRTQPQIITLTQDIKLNVELVPEFIELEEIVISDERPDENIQEVLMSRHGLKIDQLKKLPTFFGESDLIKTIQMLPGVITAGEGTSAFFVRGGSADQNLIQIDEAPIYDPSHLFGLFSVFNSDVIKDIELYKGGIPPQFGGRLSSILDVRTKDGNNRQLSGSGGIGTLASRFMLEGPINQGKSSFLISGRSSYADLFLALAGNDNRVSFYDLNLKVNWRVNNNNRFFVAAYAGNDAFRNGDDFKFNWGNKTATFRWNHLFNKKLFSNTSLIASQFDYGLDFIDPVTGLEWTADIQQFAFKEDFNYFLNPKNELNFGYHLSYQRFSPGEIKPNSEGSIFAPTELENLFALDHAFYLGNEQAISQRLSLQYGLRLSLYQNVGSSTILTYRDQQDNINIDVIDTTTVASSTRGVFPLALKSMVLVTTTY